MTKPMNTNIIIQITTSIIIALTSFIIGNRFAIGRDRRKEFNIIAEKIRLDLLKEKENLIEHNIARSSTKDTDFNKLIFQLSWWNLRRFKTLLEDYRKAKNTNYRNKKFGGSFCHDKEPVLKAINMLLKFTKLK